MHCLVRGGKLKPDMGHMDQLFLQFKQYSGTQTKWFESYIEGKQHIICRAARHHAKVIEDIKTKYTFFNDNLVFSLNCSEEWRYNGASSQMTSSRSVSTVHCSRTPLVLGVHDFSRCLSYWLHQRSIHVLTQDILHSLKRKILGGRKLAHSEIHNNNKIKQNQIDTRKSEPILCEHMSGVQQMRQWHQLNTIRHFCATLSQNCEICWNGVMLRPNARPCSLNIFSVALIIAGNGSCVGHLHFGHHHPIQSSL